MRLILPVMVFNIVAELSTLLWITRQLFDFQYTYIHIFIIIAVGMWINSQQYCGKHIKYHACGQPVKHILYACHAPVYPTLL